MLQALEIIAGSTVWVSAGVAAPSAPFWMPIRESAGTIYFDFSTTGGSSATWICWKSRIFARIVAPQRNPFAVWTAQVSCKAYKFGLLMQKIDRPARESW
jgi:hypothetical protein